VTLFFLTAKKSVPFTELVPSQREQVNHSTCTDKVELSDERTLCVDMYTNLY